MDVVDRYFIVPRHFLQGRNKRPRVFFTADDFPHQREIAAKFAQERGEDFLICLVNQEVIVKAEPESVTKLYILINKHRKGRQNQPQRRHFFTDQFVDQQRDIAASYAAELGDNYLICQVVEEISASRAAKRAARKAREHG